VLSQIADAIGGKGKEEEAPINPEVEVEGEVEGETVPSPAQDGD